MFSQLKGGSNLSYQLELKILNVVFSVFVTSSCRVKSVASGNGGGKHLIRAYAKTK